jgi:hypothetical protein
MGESLSAGQVDHFKIGQVYHFGKVCPTNSGVGKRNSLKEKKEYFNIANVQ